MYAFKTLIVYNFPIMLGRSARDLRARSIGDRTEVVYEYFMNLLMCASTSFNLSSVIAKTTRFSFFFLVSLKTFSNFNTFHFYCRLPFRSKIKSQ